MNPDIAREVLAWLSSAREVIAEQAPLLVQEIVRWGIVGNLFAAAIFIAALAATFAMKLDRRISEWSAAEETKQFGDTAVPDVTAALLWLARGVFVGIAAARCYWAICAAVAPRYYLLVQLAEFVK